MREERKLPIAPQYHLAKYRGLRFVRLASHQAQRLDQSV